jgi:hypothetical protein
MIGIPLILVGLILFGVAWHYNRGVDFGPGIRPEPRNKGAAVMALAVGLAAFAGGLYILIGGRWG